MSTGSDEEQSKPVARPSLLGQSPIQLSTPRSSLPITTAAASALSPFNYEETVWKDDPRPSILGSCLVDCAFLQDDLGLKSDLYLNWYQVQRQHMEDYSHEHDLVFSYINNLDDNIDQALTHERFTELELIRVDDKLNIHGYGLNGLLYNSISDIVKSLMPLPAFDMALNRMTTQEYDTHFQPKRRLFTLLLAKNAEPAAQDETLKKFLKRHPDSNGKSYYYFYHGCVEWSAQSICRNHVQLTYNHPYGLDFGAGFYVTRDLFEALNTAHLRSKAAKRPLSSEGPPSYQRPRPSQLVNASLRAACLIFRCPKEDFDKFNILSLRSSGTDLTTDRPPIDDATINDTNKFEWTNFVHMSHTQDHPFPVVQQYDGIDGPICINIHDVQDRKYAPRCEHKNSYQLCVRTSSFAQSFTEWITGVVVLDPSLGRSTENTSSSSSTV